MQVSKMPVRSRIHILLAEKNLERAKHGQRPISVRSLAEETQITHSALVKLVNGGSAMIAFNTLDRLMKFFGVTSLDQLLEYVPEDERGTDNTTEGGNS